MSESGLRNHLLKKCALVVRNVEGGEVTGVRLNGDTVFVGSVTLLMFERHQFGWPKGYLPDSALKSGIYIPVLVALSSAGAVLQAAVLTLSSYDKKKEVTESDLGEFLGLLSDGNEEVLDFSDLELKPLSSEKQSLCGEFLLGIKDFLRRDKLSKEAMLIPRLVEAINSINMETRKTDAA
ncbi:hypothetical protein BD408DRAFT_44919 [Parasitella parasitica]|nr:hypothetical protein BD408DRAFT_44919 [Parasitella parasitica]